MSRRALYQKLGIKESHQIVLVNPPENYTYLLDAPFKIVEPKERLSNQVDFIHLFASNTSVLEKSFEDLKKLMKPNAFFWISWPKKSARIESDLDGNLVREYGLANGLVDVKIASVNETWSALKFVYRIKDRGLFNE